MGNTPSAFLQVTQGPNPGHVHPLPDMVVLGRIPTCGVVLTDPAASRQHARIIAENGGFFVEDLQSANHTYVNNQPITKVQLRDGDLIRICRLEFCFRGRPPSGYNLTPTPVPGFVTGTMLPPTRQVNATATPVSGIRAFPEVTPPSGGYPLTDEVRLTDKSDNEEIERSIFSVVEVEDQNLAKDIRAIQNQEELERMIKRIEIINDIGNRLSTILDLDDLLKSVMEQLFTVFPNAERGFVLMVDADRKKLVPKVIHRRDGKDSSEKLQISRTIVRKSMTDKQALLIQDAAEDDNFAAAVSVMKFNIRSMMCVPLICQNEVLGIISIDTTRAGKKFRDDDLKLITAIATPIATSVRNAQLVKEKEGEVAKRTTMQRFFSPALVEKILAGTVSLEGERRSGIAFFSDIVGFTSMCNRMDAEGVVRLLNAYFEQMVGILFKHDGTIDKFSGDAIMAVWGAPENVEREAWHAIQAALEMQNALYEFNCKQGAIKGETIEMGIGLNRGEFVAGQVGASSLVNYTIIGDEVNLAARIEAKAGRGQVFISESAYEEIKQTACTVELPPIKVKGIPHPIKIYSVRGTRDIENDGSEDLVVSLPFDLTIEGAEPKRSYFNKAEFDPDHSIVFDLVSPIAVKEGQRIQCNFDLTELPEMEDAEAEIIEVRESGKVGIPQLAKARMANVPEVLRSLLTVGAARETSALWADIVR
ncbi:MAG: FHA domain-containing protein, partial [Planctomycetota bacterium]|nr:FHA domain-containing protein [Planctomycetota bacterium]MDA1142689.1 FHA domain-containing protein [Planctomycetota bacterium]